MRTVQLSLLAAEDGEINPVLPHTAELIIGLVVFGILLWLLTKKAYPKFEEIYTKRTEAIEGGIKRAEQAQAEAQQALEQYRGQLAEARTEAARIRDDARIEAERIRADLNAQAQEEANRIIAAGQAQLAAQRAQIVAELRADLGRLSVELAGKVVGESLDDEARQRGTVDRFLADLEQISAPAPTAGR